MAAHIANEGGTTIEEVLEDPFVNGSSTPAFLVRQ